MSQGNGRTALVEVTKVVKEGDGDLVKAVMEESQGGMRVCTIYLNRDPNRTTCRGENSNSSRNGRRSEFQVEMNYVVRVPAGVVVDIETVNGGVVLRGLDTPASVATVNGGIEFDAAGGYVRGWGPKGPEVQWPKSEHGIYIDPEGNVFGLHSMK